MWRNQRPKQKPAQDCYASRPPAIPPANERFAGGRSCAAGGPGEPASRPVSTLPWSPYRSHQSGLRTRPTSPGSDPPCPSTAETRPMSAGAPGQLPGRAGSAGGRLAGLADVSGSQMRWGCFLRMLLTVSGARVKVQKAVCPNGFLNKDLSRDDPGRCDTQAADSRVGDRSAGPYQDLDRRTAAPRLVGATDRATSST